MDWAKKQTSPNFFRSCGKISKKGLASHLASFQFIQVCGAVLNTVSVTCICSETTEGTQFDTLLEMVADLGRNIFKLFQVQYLQFFNY